MIPNRRTASAKSGDRFLLALTSGSEKIMLRQEIMIPNRRTASAKSGDRFFAARTFGAEPIMLKQDIKQ
jgi:hypothetical protein